jgi:hypothetical protein
MKTTSAFLITVLLAAGRALAAPAPADFDDEPPPPPPTYVAPAPAQLPPRLELAPPALRVAETKDVRANLRTASATLFSLSAVNAVAVVIGGGLFAGPQGDCNDICLNQAVGVMMMMVGGAIAAGGLVAGIIVEAVRARWPEARNVAASSSGLTVRF